MSRRVVAVGRVEDGRVMYGSIAADFGSDSDRAVVTPAFPPKLRLSCERCGAVCGDLSDRHPMCFACEVELAAPFQVGARVRLRSLRNVVGTVDRVYVGSYPREKGVDVLVTWDDGQVTQEANSDLEFGTLPAD